MSRILLLLGAALLLAACGERGAAETADTIVLDAPTTTMQSSSTTVPANGQEPADDEIDLVTYVAAIEDAVAGTSYAGEALQSPEVFLATGTLFCEQLDSGMTPDAVVTGYIEALTAGPVEEAAGDELTMAGGVLGVGVVTLCPQHMDTLAGSS